MNIWENTVLTDQGKALQAKLLQGQTLKISRVTTGSKKVPIVDLRQQADVTEGGYDITLQPSRTEGEKTVLPVLLENTGLKESYDLWQVGFFAEDPDEGEILFCISQASQAKHIPSEAESPGYSVTWDFYFNTSNSVPFEVVLNSSGLVNIEAYQEHTNAISEVNKKVDSLNSALDIIDNDLNHEIYLGKISDLTSSYKKYIVEDLKKYRFLRFHLCFYENLYQTIEVSSNYFNATSTSKRICFSNNVGAEIYKDTNNSVCAKSDRWDNNWNIIICGYQSR